METLLEGVPIWEWLIGPPVNMVSGANKER